MRKQAAYVSQVTRYTVEKTMAVTAIVIFYDQWRLRYFFKTTFYADNIKNAIPPPHYSRQVCR